MNGTSFADQLNSVLGAINGVIWHDIVLYIVLGVGLLFTVWTSFCQYRALTHGTAVVRGRYDDKDDPGAINHFQALSAALSATVGLGNIAGVALAISLGGPGAVFWMWVIGVVGMALKTTEVALSMMYRNTDNPDNPHGGPMYVASRGFAKMGLPGLGKVVGGTFVIVLLIGAVTGGNMFQAWNVGIVTENAFGVPTVLTGIFLALLVGAVIIGGIKRIGAVAGRLVPFMCLMYLLSAGYVLILNFGEIPSMLRLIVTSAFGTLEAEGAFVGGVWGYALLWGMKRALFSSEAGQGSSPIAHSAAKTDEPVREAVVAGLEPFIDTLVVCTLTSLVILSTGAWNRSGEAEFQAMPQFTRAEAGSAGTPVWTLGETPLPGKSDQALRTAGGNDWDESDAVFVIAAFGDTRSDTGDRREKILGDVQNNGNGLVVQWDTVASDDQPQLVSAEIYKEYPGAALTTHAFDRVTPGLGTWLILLASWLFAISTMISWSYYGEQGVVWLFGERHVLGYKVVYCLLVIVATAGFIRTDAELDNLTTLGTGIMLWANIPIMLVFGYQAMREYRSYMKRLDAGEFHPHKAPSIRDVVEGHDVE